MDSSSGSNVPQIDLKRALEPEALAAWWDAQLSALEALLMQPGADGKRGHSTEALLASYQRMPAAISNDVVQAASATLRKMIHERYAAIEALRTDVKAPVIAAGRVIDEGAKERTVPLAVARAEIDKRSAAYTAAKAAAADVTVLLADAGRVRDEMSGAMVSPRFTQDFEVTSINGVPREWLVQQVDRARVLAAKKAAPRLEINGIRFFQRAGVTMR